MQIRQHFELVCTLGVGQSKQAPVLNIGSVECTPLSDLKAAMHSLALLLSAALAVYARAEQNLSAGSYVAADAALPQRVTVECRHNYSTLPDGCRPSRCGRAVLPAVLSGEEAAELKLMTNRAIAWAVRDVSPRPLKPSADAWIDGKAPPPPFLNGPTIVDVNTGFVRHAALGLRNLYKSKRRGLKPFQLSPASRIAYQRAGTVLESLLKEEFGLEHLYFTAPTFVARLQGSAAWTAQDIHDEYWHAHVDKVGWCRACAAACETSGVRSPSMRQ